MASLPKRTRADHAQVAARLFANPRAWGTVNVYPTRQSALSVAGSIRSAEGRFHMYGPSGYYETRLSVVENGTLLEARYIGRAPSAKSRRKQADPPEPERVLGQIECEHDAVRAIAARHEAAYGSAWHTTPATPDTDALWADALAGLDEEER
jgi:hypothetical protein